MDYNLCSEVTDPVIKSQPLCLVISLSREVFLCAHIIHGIQWNKELPVPIPHDQYALMLLHGSWFMHQSIQCVQINRLSLVT